jgi:hypothetical protein
MLVFRVLDCALPLKKVQAKRAEISQQTDFFMVNRLLNFQFKEFA